ncbi:amidohydrolase family protein [Aliidiomarina maris]|uniref:Amidohydrolase n=1 Tax=Aliidiomarina maris TaxID=531312 RepID=A0A327X4C3_9GAMM|nr:amidohydrolase family protein [Aliidiomarina maris]RAK01735.1 imidazolonepropionase-like amidohydrolase [Aliidiomarina maris]RUO28552.1 amidohydrolase [Aliidiomarina maris]
MIGNWRIASCVLAALGTVAVGHSHASQTTPVRGLHDNSPSLVALQNATVVAQPGEQLENATIVIENGKITAVNRNNSAPAGARIVDAAGYTIYPGFIDPYSNYGVPQPGQAERYRRDRPAQYDNPRSGGNASNAAIHSQTNWVDHLSHQGDAAKAYLEQGFTTVQSARMDGIFRGRATTISLANDIPNQLVYRPRAAQFASFDKGSSEQQYPASLMGSIALIRQTLSDARWYNEAQGRTLGDGSVLEYNAALAGLQNLADQGVIFETSDEHDVLRAHQVFQEFDIPVTFVGSGYEYARIDDMRATSSRFVVPLNFPAAPDVSAEFAELDVDLGHLRHWERAPGNPAQLAAAGIDFAFTLHGLESRKDFLPNLRKAVAHGLGRDTALAALTTQAARIAGVEETSGRISAGYHADLVITRGDLFADGEIVSVWTQGREHVIQPMHPTQFAGEYELNVGGQSLNLQINTGARDRGQLSQADTRVDLAHVRRDADTLSFAAQLEEFGLAGVYRFTVRAGSREYLRGSYTDPEGRSHAIRAIRQQQEESSATAQEPAQIEYVSRLSFPNIGLGVDAPAQARNLIIKNATIWTSSDAGIIENADMIVRDGRIVRVGQGLSTPRGYTEIDATGMHVTPGIVDEHSHIAIARGVNEGTEAITSEVRIGDVVNPDDVHIYRSLAGGTTVAHLLHGSANPIGGQGQNIKLRWGQNAEGLKFTETPPTIKMALGENVKQSNWGITNNRYPQTRMGVDAIIHDFFRTAREYQQAHDDYANLNRRERNRTAPPRRDYRLEALAEILAEQRHIHAHSYVASEVVALMQTAEELGFNIHTFTHILEGYKVAPEMAAHGARASTFADWWAFKIEAFDAIPYNACAMMDQGVLTSLNSDSNDLQRRMNIEAAKSVRYCGMDEQEALKMITLYPAMQLEIADLVGSLEAGKHADFVLWNAHPLSAYAQVQQTWIEGAKYFDREQDLARRAEIESERQQLVQRVLDAGSDALRGSRANYREQQPSWHCDTDHDVWRDHALHSEHFGQHLMHSHSHSHGGHH